MTSILWFRQDLRLHDQPALRAAAAGGAIIPLYILDDDTPGDWRIGGAQRWWLHASLASLDASLRKHGSRLIIRRGRADEVLRDMLEESGATQVHAVRHYEPWWRKVEQSLGERLCLHDGNHLTRIEDVRTGGGKPFRIYSSFWKALQSFLPPEQPVAAPRKIEAPAKWPTSLKLADLDLLPTKPDWAVDFDGTPGEEEARKKARAFAKRVDRYEALRNLPAEEGTSMLSPHLHFGEISVREVWHAVSDHPDAVKFQKELAWRDFTDGVVLALPDYADKNGRPKYDALHWRTGKQAKADLRAWQRGRTGYPIVDAGMRQLWTSGWMHNRLRMITASFLIKHLLIDWREGERWFWDCLVDADYGNNSVNWQWIAGTGVDANMFSRIMAPLTQSEKFDAGDYIRRWVPELADVPDAAIHDPEAAGCCPDDYPAKIIGHREARERALAAAARLR
ncbi:deoxyribodipyrimidine photo-lyase type I [Sphingomonas palmae]|uniref:Deoxyribodipyrimidine photo-lyase type I n=1 Tax=Sphingomonas palmae TaxID=1855283 RepID=A0A1H7H070_9SPHN|nr:deoxyribodipyrimidine photo-lyase [Sphingomonas palmae]SEK43803.1 deoxyribodipyrimidine photo-lyase type I [Sphingomonas palmae]